MVRNEANAEDADENQHFLPRPLKLPGAEGGRLSLLSLQHLAGGTVVTESHREEHQQKDGGSTNVKGSVDQFDGITVQVLTAVFIRPVRFQGF